MLVLTGYRKYNFKGKRRKVNEEDEEQELAESVRTISALFQAGGNLILPGSEKSLQDEPLEVRVASISAEIAAAIAQAQSRVYGEVENGDDDGDQSGSGQEGIRLEIITPNTSGIRDDVLAGGEAGQRMGEEEDDSDAFPMPLRERRDRKSVV